MVAEFVREVPTVEIEDGLVHTVWAGGEAYWKPSTFRRFVETGRLQLAKFDSGACVLPFKGRG